ncbi:MAG: 2-C-methyl-D-erythritol 2,4-cyclodiphosphate synthase, partial [Peptococcaceae bacterium]|nr:2-C-methyl-D-erythritol 2,4-cyclodiphosphate synthase [Peptococcaceae bacterium]
MEENLAKAVKVEKEAVIVKTTTTEKLGFEGEGLGMSAYAVCTIKKRT